MKDPVPVAARRVHFEKPWGAKRYLRRQRTQRTDPAGEKKEEERGREEKSEERRRNRTNGTNATKGRQQQQQQPGLLDVMMRTTKADEMPINAADWLVVSCTCWLRLLLVF